MLSTKETIKQLPTEAEIEAAFQKICASFEAFFNIKGFDDRFKISDRMGIECRDDIYFSQAMKELAIEKASDSESLEHPAVNDFSAG